MRKFNITIVGTGNSGCAHAWLLSKLGHHVSLLKTSNSVNNENFNALVTQGGIFCIDSTHSKGQRDFAKIHLITRDAESAFQNAEIVIVLTQSLQHQHIAELILPYIQNIQALLIVPGNLGSLFFRNSLPKNVIVAEGESTIIDARILTPGTVNILFKNVRNALSFNPAIDSERGFNLFSSILANYTHIRSNIIESAMHNPNMIVHTIGTIMSASRIEFSGGDFWMYKEAFTESIWNLIYDLDQEKNAVIEAYGGIPESYLDCCKFRNEKSLDEDSYRVFKNYAEHGSPKGPASIHNRYLLEDVPNGLGLLRNLAKIAHIETPVADSLIRIASSLLQTDFMSISRNPASLGFESHPSLMDYIHDGVK